MPKRGWEEAFTQAAKDVVPLVNRDVESQAAHLTVANIVSTYQVVPTGCRLPLEAIAIHQGVGCQYAPVQFAANIISIVGAEGGVTVLIFGSGKVVVVSAVTPMHAWYIVQMVRVIIESVVCAIRREDGTIYLGTLAERTIIGNMQICNVVGHYTLRWRIDLTAFHAAFSASTRLHYQLFPAVQCSVWLTPDQKCHCTKKRREARKDAERVYGRAVSTQCGCTVKCLTFASGQIVIIGARSVDDIYRVLQHMKDLLRPFRTNKTTDFAAPAPRAPPPPLPPVDFPESTLPYDAEGVTRAILDEITGYKTRPRKMSVAAQKSTLPPFLMVTQAGRLMDAMDFYALDPSVMDQTDEFGRTAAELLSYTERSLDQEQVHQWLQTLK